MSSPMPSSRIFLLLFAFLGITFSPSIAFFNVFSYAFFAHLSSPLRLPWHHLHLHLLLHPLWHLLRLPWHLLRLPWHLPQHLLLLELLHHLPLQRLLLLHLLWHLLRLPWHLLHLPWHLLRPPWHPLRLLWHLPQHHLLLEPLHH